MSARAMRNVSEAMDRDSRHQDPAPTAVPAPSLADRTFHVFGSGNLGLVYVRGEERQLTRQQLDERFPALVAGLAAHPGIAFAVVTDALEGPVALGADGSRRLRDGVVRGTDPLLPFGERANDFVLRVATRPEAPDIYVNSLLEPGTEEVAAFEGLVGCHGGLGGWQERACLVVPAHLPWPDAPLVGADALHVALRDVLVHLGHRRQLVEADRRPDEPAPSARVGTSG